MASTVMSFATNIVSTLKNNSISVLNIVIAIGTFGSEKLLSTVVFRCPCLEKDFTNTNTPTTFITNCSYGMVFIFMPAIVLFIIGYCMNPITWRLITGCCCKSTSTPKNAKSLCDLVLQILLRSLVAPISWICVAFLDGKYYACAMTTNPYNQTCEEVYRDDAVKYSVEYYAFVATSQVIGWIIIGSSFVMGTLAFTVLRCCATHTYWHTKYLVWTKEIESQVYEKKAREKIKIDADDHMKLFFENSQTENDWDNITTLCEESMLLKPNGVSTSKTAYSSLQKWAEERTETGMNHDEK